jgi:hypothetical protein
MTTIVDPRGIGWDQWCSMFCEQFAEIQIAPYPEEQWKQFADDIASRSTFSGPGFPGSLGFDDWRDWASRLVGIWN